jgi:hypothetical protein
MTTQTTHVAAPGGCVAAPLRAMALLHAYEAPAGGRPRRTMSAIAAGAAGIDLANQDAVDTFVAGWNARSSIP